MIYVEMYGRLGNQFFRYAAARAVQLKLYPNEKICLSLNQVIEAGRTDETFYNVLEDFKVSDYEIYNKSGKVIFNESSFTQKLICFLYYLKLRKINPEEMNDVVKYEKKWKNILINNGIYWFRRGYWKINKSKNVNKFISGNYESPEFFEDIKEVLLKEFTPKYDMLSKNKEMYKLINSKNSVCISVRRGDFESNYDIKKLHSVCSKEYFKKAIKVIKEKLNNPVFFLFSDDIEWVKNNIFTDCETYYEDGTDPVWEKLRLMSSCKHFIISNSTFSWWAQYLSLNKDKIVVSPKRWYNNDFESPLIDKKWILIDV